MCAHSKLSSKINYESIGKRLYYSNSINYINKLLYLIISQKLVYNIT